MTSINKNKPQPATTNTQKTEAPKTPATSTPLPEELAADSSIEELQGKSMQPTDAMDTGSSVQPPKTQATLTRPQTTAEKVVSSDPIGVTKLASDALKGLKPGESVAIGAKGDALIDGIAVAAEGSIEIEKRKDGKYEVKVGVGGGVGVGAETDRTFGKSGASGGLVGRSEYTYVVDNPADAAKIAAEAAVIMSVPGSQEGLAQLNSDAIESRKLEVGFGMELAAELKLNHGKGLGGGFTGEVTGAIVVEGDEAFLELKGEAEVEGEATFHEVGLAAASAKGELTVRIPLGRVDGANVNDPEVRERLMKEARARGKEGAPEGTTMTMSVEVTGGPALGAGATLESEKTVRGNALAALRGPGWETRVSVDFGARPSLPLGVVSLEVEAVVNKTAYESKGGTLDEEIAKANEHKGEIDKLSKDAVQTKKQSGLGVKYKG